MTRRQLARLAAPAAFLLGVTLAVLLVRAGLEGGARPARTSTAGPVTHTATARPATSSGRTRARTSTATAGAQYYVVRKGDTFGSIAAAHGVSVAEIEQLNPGVSSNALRVGQRIRVR